MSSSPAVSRQADEAAADAAALIFDLDAVAWLRTLDAESVDLVITDPAYESLEKHRAKGTTTRLSHSSASSNDWFDIFPNVRFPEFFAEVYRVLARDRHFYMICDQETMFVAKPIGEAAGFVFQKALIWDKLTIGMGYNWRNQHEVICFFKKGKRRLNDLSLGDVLYAKRVRGGYPTEKPVELLEPLVLNSSQPGELVIDPFMGSGSTGVASLNFKRQFAGTDISPVAREIARARFLTFTPAENL